IFAPHAGAAHWDTGTMSRRSIRSDGIHPRHSIPRRFQRSSHRRTTWDRHPRPRLRLATFFADRTPRRKRCFPPALSRLAAEKGKSWGPVATSPLTPPDVFAVVHGT